MTDLSLAAYENRTYNLSKSVYLLQGTNAAEVSTEWFLNFQRFELSRVNFSHKNRQLVQVCECFDQSRVREIGGKITVLELSKSKGNNNLFELLRGSRNHGFENRDTTVGNPLSFPVNMGYKEELSVWYRLSLELTTTGINC